MTNLVRDSLANQYSAALTMLQECVDRADATVWHATVGRFDFWHVAYHVLHTTDLYLSADEAAFRPQEFHREGYEMLGAPFWAPDMEVEIGEPYDPATISRYIAICRAKATHALEAESDRSLAGASGFEWLEFSRLELHIYNVRHIQHHTGQLVAALRSAADTGVAWAFSDAS